MRWRPYMMAGLGLLGALAVGRGVFGLPERCGDVTTGEVRAAAAEAVGWFERNQLDDGRWVYRYDRGADELDLRPHLVRHAGVTMSLYQAADHGIDGAVDVADRGTEWALANGITHDDWRALELDGNVPSGGTALLLAGLAVRRDATGDPVYDDEMEEMGRFLVEMTEPSGAVLAQWDPTTGEPVPDHYSIFYTGETLWALSMMATVDPDGGWLEPAERIARYIATERDDAEDIFPPTSDHWGAYGISQLAVGAGVELDGETRDFVERLTGIFSIQVRYESQRTGSGLNKTMLRGDQALGAGLGTLGEGLGSLYGMASASDDSMVPIDPLAERTACVAGMLVDRQVDADDAAALGTPDAARGAWFTGDVTQKDDQQHSLSALLLAEPVLESGFTSGATSGDPSVARVLWLGVIALAAVNPLRSRRAAGPLPRGPVLIGTLIGLVTLAVLAVVGGPVLRAIDVSPPTALVAAGGVLVLTCLVDLLRPQSVPIPPLGAGALAPMAFPIVLRGSVVMLPLAIAAMYGTVAGLVAAAGAAGGAVLGVLPRRQSGSGSPVRGGAVGAAVGDDAADDDADAGTSSRSATLVISRAGARLLTAVAMLGAVDLMVHGVFGV